MEGIRNGRIHDTERSVDICQRKHVGDRGALLEEEGDLVREYQALNEDNFQSSWLREDVEGIEERRKEMDKKAREEEGSSVKREVEREEETTCNFDDLCSVEVLGALGFPGGALVVALVVRRCVGLRGRLRCLVCVLGFLFFRALRVSGRRLLFRFLKLNLLHHSLFLSLESVKPSLWKVKEMCIWRVRPKTCSHCQQGIFKKWIVEPTNGGQRSTNRLQKGWTTVKCYR